MRNRLQLLTSCVGRASAGDPLLPRGTFDFRGVLSEFSWTSRSLTQKGFCLVQSCMAPTYHVVIFFHKCNTQIKKKTSLSFSPKAAHLFLSSHLRGLAGPALLPRPSSPPPLPSLLSLSLTPRACMSVPSPTSGRPTATTTPQLACWPPAPLPLPLYAAPLP